MTLGAAAACTDRLAGCREALRRVARDSRQGGAVLPAISALTLLCHDGFVTGAWDEAQRLAGELRATRLIVTRTECHGTAVLTAQEHQIAALAAAGLTNKQIGQRLYLSPRTISAHLYRIFPKLGISTRAALRDALAALSPGDSLPTAQAEVPDMLPAQPGLRRTACWPTRCS